MDTDTGASVTYKTQPVIVPLGEPISITDRVEATCAILSWWHQKNTRLRYTSAIERASMRLKKKGNP
jgi:hypothetical protein